MLETNDAYLTELAQHIVTLADFWRRKTTALKPDPDIRIIRTLIETGLDLDAEYAEPIARQIVKKLDALDAVGCSHGANGANWRVEVVSAVLRQNTVPENEQPTLFEASAPL